MDKHRSGRPAIVDDDALRKLVKDDPRLTVREVGNILKCSKTTAARRLKAIGIVKNAKNGCPMSSTECKKNADVMLV